MPLFNYVNPILHRRREYQTLPSKDSSCCYGTCLITAQRELMGAGIGVTEAWDYTRGDPSTSMAAMDEGFELDHRKVGADDHIVGPFNVIVGTPGRRPILGKESGEIFVTDAGEPPVERLAARMAPEIAYEGGRSHG